MSNKILLPQLVSILAASTGTAKKQTETFLKAYFSIIGEALEDHDTVKVKDLGTFKVSRVEARKSVNVSTGEDVKIPPHYKVVFTPSKTLAEKVNKEFAWLEIVEISEGISNTELEKAGEDTEERVEEPLEDMNVSPVSNNEEEQEEGDVDEQDKDQSHLKVEETEPEPTVIVGEHDEEEKREEEYKELEKSEELGEKLEEDFGNIEPVEPFGPVDPDEPDLNEPLQESIKQDKAVSLESEKEEKDVLTPVVEESPVIAAAETVYNEVVQPEEPRSADFTSSAHNVHTVASTEMKQEFDPYALEKASEPAKDEVLEEGPYYVTKDELDSYASKSDFKILARNIKKLRNTVEENQAESIERGKRTVVWCMILCAALLIGGFFLTYWLISNRMEQRMARTAQGMEINIEEDIEEEQGDSISISGLDSHANETSEPSASPEQEAPSGVSAAAPTTPSDIKAMDRVTNTRYLTTMAKEHYGNYNFWPYIYLENEGKLGHPDRIKPGTAVVIPNIEKYHIDPTNPKDVEKAKRLGVEIYRKYAHN